jgi:hypothetical protein
VAAGTTPTAWNESTRSFTSTDLTLPLDWGKQAHDDRRDDDDD